MATKAGLISAINGFITSVVNITKHRNSMLEIVNSLFQTTTEQVFATGSNNWQYNLRYKKIGNIVYIDGFILNTFSNTRFAETMVTIPNSELYAKTGQDTRTFGVSSYPAYFNIEIVFTGSSINLLGYISPSQRIYINSHYQTND